MYLDCAFAGESTNAGPPLSLTKGLPPLPLDVIYTERLNTSEVARVTTALPGPGDMSWISWRSMVTISSVATGIALASQIAWRSEPAPLSAVLVTKIWADARGQSAKSPRQSADSNPRGQVADGLPANCLSGLRRMSGANMRRKSENKKLPGNNGLQTLRPASGW